MTSRTALVLAVIAGCYDAPKPACGFRCGPSAACPADYACADDGLCHLAGAPVTPCGVDAGLDAFDFWPFILSVSPVEDATGVAIDVTPAVRFTEQVTGVSATSFTLARMDDGSPVTGTVTYDTATRTATFDPTALLAPSTFYVATLGSEIADLAGNPLYGKRAWTFKTTFDMSAPFVVDIVPYGGATGVAVDAFVVITFSEQVTMPNGSIGLEDADGPIAAAVGYVSQTAVKYTPAQPLLANHEYTLTLTPAITDLTGNVLKDAPVISSFTTAP